MGKIVGQVTALMVVGWLGVACSSADEDPNFNFDPVEAAPAVPSDAAPPPLETLYVTTEGTDQSNTCSAFAAPCRSIGHAVTVAQMKNTLIEVGAGTFEENIRIDFGRVMIHGPGVLRPPAHTDTPPIDVRGGLVTVSDVQIEGGKAGVFCHDSHAGDNALLMQNVRITNNLIGLVLSGCKVRVERSTIVANGEPIQLLSGTLEIVDSFVGNTVVE